VATGPLKLSFQCLYCRGLVWYLTRVGVVMAWYLQFSALNCIYLNPINALYYLIYKECKCFLANKNGNRL
jgi:hypothetical protein